MGPDQDVRESRGGEIEDAKVAGGLGIRYFLARHLGLRVGIDIARGPDETAFYITVGNAWR